MDSGTQEAQLVAEAWHSGGATCSRHGLIDRAVRSIRHLATAAKRYRIGPIISRQSWNRLL
jgi:hypothetical protein